MDNIEALAHLLARTVANQDHLEVGVIAGEQVLVRGAFYSPSWAADVDRIDGAEVYCVVSRGRCVVVGLV